MAAVTSLLSTGGVLPARALQRGQDHPSTLAWPPSWDAEGRTFPATLADLPGEELVFWLIMYCKDSCNGGSSKLLPHGLLICGRGWDTKFAGSWLPVERGLSPGHQDF